MEELVLKISIWGVPVLAAVVLHELAHGWVAFKLGDSTAQRAGRLTLNPVAHIDPIGTVLLPLFLIIVHSPFLFGYARPVPVNPENLRQPRRDMMLVAAAGPLMNLLLALASALVRYALLAMHVEADSSVYGSVIEPLAMMARSSVGMNIVLFVFNMLPIPPLDGGRVVSCLLTGRSAATFARIEPFGMLIVMVLLASSTLNNVLDPLVSFFLRVLL